MIYKDSRQISFCSHSIKGTQYFSVTFDTEDNAKTACTIQVSDDNQTKYDLISNIVSTASAKTFLIIVHNIPLDVNKQLLFQYLQKYENTKSIKYKVYAVLVIYK